MPKPLKFPLARHVRGQWIKRHKGRTYYFGTDKDAALKRFVSEWPDILAGHGRPSSSAATFSSVTISAPW